MQEGRPERCCLHCWWSGRTAPPGRRWPPWSGCTRCRVGVGPWCESGCWSLLPTSTEKGLSHFKPELTDQLMVTLWWQNWWWLYDDKLMVTLWWQNWINDCCCWVVTLWWQNWINDCCCWVVTLWWQNWINDCCCWVVTLWWQNWVIGWCLNNDKTHGDFVVTKLSQLLLLMGSDFIMNRANWPLLIGDDFRT